MPVTVPKTEGIRNVTVRNAVTLQPWMLFHFLPLDGCKWKDENVELFLRLSTLDENHSNQLNVDVRSLVLTRLLAQFDNQDLGLADSSLIN